MLLAMMLHSTMLQYDISLNESYKSNLSFVGQVTTTTTTQTTTRGHSTTTGEPSLSINKLTWTNVT